MFSFSLVPFDTRKGEWGGMDYLLLQLCPLPKKIGHFEDHLKDFKRKEEVLWADRDTQASEQLSWKFHATGPRSVTPPAKGKLCWIVAPLITPGMQEISCFTCYAPQSNKLLDRKDLKVSRTEASWTHVFHKADWYSAVQEKGGEFSERQELLRAFIVPWQHLKLPSFIPHRSETLLLKSQHFFVKLHSWYAASPKRQSPRLSVQLQPRNNQGDKKKPKHITAWQLCLTLCRTGWWAKANWSKVFFWLFFENSQLIIVGRIQSLRRAQKTLYHPRKNQFERYIYPQVQAICHSQYIPLVLNGSLAANVVKERIF